MFEKASREKLRFDTSKGQISHEDLWDLPLQSTKGINLDDIAKGLHRQLKSADDVSFVDDTKTSSDKLLQLRFDIVKHVIDTRKAENAAVADQRRKADEKATLLEALAEREKTDLKSVSADELRARIAAL